MAEPRGTTVESLIGAIAEDETGEGAYRIGDLAKEFGTTLRALRFYEDKGLLRPTRRGTTRIYSENDRRQLRVILLWKLLGFTLVEAQAFLAVLNDPTKRHERVTLALDELDRRRPALIERQHEIADALRAMDVVVASLSGQNRAMTG